MKTSHDWPILKEMAKDGAYPDGIWEYADLIAKDQTPTGYVDGLGCK
jgi:hypothetical protein